MQKQLITICSIAVLSFLLTNAFRNSGNLWSKCSANSRTKSFFAKEWIQKISNSDDTLNHHRFITMSSKFKLRMSMVTDDKTDASTQTATSVSVDFSQYAVGQEHEGSLISAKNFGVFVGIANGVNVLLPRSLLSKGSYDKLKKLVEAKSSDKIRLEIVGVSAENKTISGKYLPPGYQSRADISSLQGVDLSSKLFNATVVSVHDFGIFAELEEYGVDGLIPASKLPQKMSADEIASSYPVGSQVVVKIDELNISNKKLVLSMKNARADVSAFSSVASDKWLQGVVQKVTDFGLFVRPAGYDTAGLVHRSQVPRDLIAALKKKLPPSKVVNQTDVEYLFSAGDVVKVRVQAVSVDTRRLELSMLPPKSKADEEDEYIVEGRDPEGEEFKSYEDADEEEEAVSYDAEDTLLWWRGARYVKEESNVVAVDEEAAVLNESPAIVEGTWRRLFEVDMREDAADFSTKILEAELKELEEEIGELGGLDEDLIDATGFGYKPKYSLGSSIAASVLPADFKAQLEFFKEVEASEQALNTQLRRGKEAEKEQFEAMIKEAELEAAGQRRGPAGAVPVDTPAPVAEPVVAALVETVVEEPASVDESAAASE